MKHKKRNRQSLVDTALLRALATAPEGRYMMAEYFADLATLSAWSLARVRKALNRLAREGYIEREQRVDERTGNRYMVYRLKPAA